MLIENISLFVVIILGLAGGALAALVKSTCSSFPFLGKFLKWYKDKPLNCNICLSTWSCILLSLFLDGADTQERIIYILASSGLACYILNMGYGLVIED